VLKRYRQSIIGSGKVSNDPLLSLSDTVRIFNAVACGLDTVSKHRFSLEGALSGDLLMYWTGVSDKEMFDYLFLTPLQEYYESETGKKHRPRKTTYSVSDRVYWCVSMLWRGFTFSELYSHAGKGYKGGVFQFSNFVRRTLVHLASANSKYLNFPSR
jgi:hypothetical protein